MKGILSDATFSVHLGQAGKRRKTCLNWLYCAFSWRTQREVTLESGRLTNIYIGSLHVGKLSGEQKLMYVYGIITLESQELREVRGAVQRRRPEATLVDP